MSRHCQAFRLIGPLAILLSIGAAISTQEPFDAPLPAAISAALILLTLGGAAMLIGFRSNRLGLLSDSGRPQMAVIPTQTGMRIRITYRTPG
jgi:hypothetical protein